MNDNINTDNILAGSMNDNINTDSIIAGSMNDNINTDSIIAGSMNDPPIILFVFMLSFISVIVCGLFCTEANMCRFF
jgi:hypothetical protein